MSASVPIAFWGSPGISAALLQQLLQDNRFTVKFVVTQADKPRSLRGREILPSPVKKTAMAAGIPVFEPQSLKKEGNLINEAAKKYSISFHVVLAYGKIIPEFLFRHPPLQSVNFHASLLPKFRGASPVESALLQDFPETGWSLQRITTELDAGDVYGQIKVRIDPWDDAVALYHKLQDVLLQLGPDLLFAYANGELTPKPQAAEQATFCGKLSSDAGKLNFQQPVQSLRALARALAARGGVYAFWEGRRVKILADYQKLAEPNQKLDLVHPPGMLVLKPAPAIAAADGLFWVRGVQPEGKRPMTVQEFLNGYGRGKDLFLS